MARIFITGGSGFVGAHVVRRMVADGHEVTVFGPAPEPCLTDDDLKTINFLSGGVEEPGALDAMIGTAKPEIVIGLAAYGGSGRGLLAAAAEQEAAALAVNVAGFRNLLAACERLSVARVIWSSTLAVYGAAALYPDAPVDEAAPRRPETFYGLTKVLAEDIARYYREARGLPITGIRLPVVFGPGLWYRGAGTQIIDMFQAAATGGKAELEVSTSPLEIMYVTDVANAIAEVAGHPGPLDLIYNLCAYAPSLHDMVAVLKELSPDLQVETTDVDPPLTYPLVSSRKLADELGIQSTYSLEQACAAYVDALRSDH